jgi:hypothetical protein
MTMQSDLFQESNGKEIFAILELMAGIYEAQKTATGNELSPEVKAWIAHKQNEKFSEAEYLKHILASRNLSQVLDLPF